MTERVIALDPGGTTGWAMWQDTKFPGTFEGRDEKVWEHFTCGQIGPEEHHEELYELLERMQTHKFIVICESFEFRQSDNHREGTVLISREYIGVAKLFTKRRGGLNLQVHYVSQSPSQAKGFVSDEKLKAMGLYVPGQRHARDALKHLVYYLVNKKHMHQLIKPWQQLT